MKKVIYVIVLSVLCIIGLPFMLLAPNKWNNFGRKVDAYFGIDSPHTKNYKKKNEV